MTKEFASITQTSALPRARAETSHENWSNDFADRSEIARLSKREIEFIEQCDSFYIASVSETGWPFVQHCGGASGPLRILDDRTLAFADPWYHGGAGGLTLNERVCLFLIDYPAQIGLKMHLHAEASALDINRAPAGTAISEADNEAAQRTIRLRLVTLDWDCSQEIVPRYTQAEFLAASRRIRAEFALLDRESAALRAS